VKLGQTVLPEASVRFHERALAGDRTVSSELWLHIHQEFFGRLRARFRTLDDTDIADAITDVVLGYTERPTAFHPDKLPLDRYLAMAIRGDLLNLIEKRQRQPKFISLTRVVDDGVGRNSEQEVETTYGDDYLPDGVSREMLMKKLRDILPSPTDQEVYEMMSDGVRETTRYAQVLGCETLDSAAQRKLVKQAKDRIRVRLKRCGLRFHV